MLRAMPCLRLRWLAAYLATAALALFFASCSPEPELARPNVAPNVPHRVAELTDAGLASDVRGRILLGELGCAGCHEANQAQLEHRQGPDLRTVGSRVHPDFLERFIASPHATAPGTTMPDLLRHLEGGAAGRGDRSGPADGAQTAPRAEVWACVQALHMAGGWVEVVTDSRFVRGVAALRGGACPADWAHADLWEAMAPHCRSGVLRARWVKAHLDADQARERGAAAEHASSSGWKRSTNWN